MDKHFQNQKELKCIKLYTPSQQRALAIIKNNIQRKTSFAMYYVLDNVALGPYFIFTVKPLEAMSCAG